MLIVRDVCRLQTREPHSIVRRKGIPCLLEGNYDLGQLRISRLSGRVTSVFCNFYSWVLAIILYGRNGLRPSLRPSHDTD